MPDHQSDEFERLVTLYAPEAVTALAFSPDGSLLAVAAADKVHLYQVPQWARLPQSGTPKPGLPTSTT